MWLKLGGDMVGFLAGVAKNGDRFLGPPPLALWPKTKKTAIRGIRPIDLSANSDYFVLLCVAPPSHFIEPGSSYVLRCTPQSFLGKPARPLYYVFPISLS